MVYYIVELIRLLLGYYGNLGEKVLAALHPEKRRSSDSSFVGILDNLSHTAAAYHPLPSGQPRPHPAAPGTGRLRMSFHYAHYSGIP